MICKYSCCGSIQQKNQSSKKKLLQINLINRKYWIVVLITKHLCVFHLLMLQRERARGGRAGGACCAQTQINPSWNDWTGPQPQSQQGPGSGSGDSSCDWWHKGAATGVSWTLTDLWEHRLRLSPASTGWQLSPVPGTAGRNPQGFSLPPGEWIPLKESSPSLAVGQEPRRHGPRVSIAQRLLTQCWMCLGAKPLPVLGHWDAPSLFAPPKKRNEKSLGMLQARSLCFRLFSTKRLGNKAHSFPSRESERVHFRKQILKT